MLRRAIEAVMQQFEPFGARPNKVGIIMPQDPEQQFSVANPDTPYVIGVFDLNQAGPMAVEVPEGPYMGTLDNHHMEWFGDMSTIGSGKGMGEKDLLMPPGYDCDILDGYTPHYSQTRKLILLMRVAVPTGHYDEAVALARKLKVYALGNDASAQTYEIVDVKGNPASLPMLTWEMSMDYWRQFHSVIDHEIAQPRHRFMAGLPNLGGIPKGQAFEPDARMETILTDAATTGWSEMNVNFVANGHPESLTWPDLNWEFILLIGPLNPETERFRNSQLLGLGLE